MTLDYILSPMELEDVCGDSDFGSLVICAIRYCIGRQTYMPGVITAYVKPILPYLDSGTLLCIKRDLEEAPYFGDPLIDKPTWDHFKQAVDFECTNRNLKA